MSLCPILRLTKSEEGKATNSASIKPLSLPPMQKKYFYFIYLIGAILLLYWVKTNQQSGTSNKNAPSNKGTSAPQRLDRSLSEFVYSKHALCRMDCRQIDKTEVQEIWQNGVLNEKKIERSSKGVSYPLEGVTHDGQKVRIVFAPKAGKLVIVTVIDLEREWSCDCE